jgi:hypothetical protein
MPKQKNEQAQQALNLAGRPGEQGQNIDEQEPPERDDLEDQDASRDEDDARDSAGGEEADNGADDDADIDPDDDGRSNAQRLLRSQN